MKKAAESNVCPFYWRKWMLSHRSYWPELATWAPVAARDARKVGIWLFQLL